jgi:hypothetical protein
MKNFLHCNIEFVIEICVDRIKISNEDMRNDGWDMQWNLSIMRICKNAYELYL